MLWTGVTDRFVVNQNEFFNRSVGPVYYVGGPTPGGLAETEVTKRRVRRYVPHRRRASASTAPTCSPTTRSRPTACRSPATPDVGMTLWRIEGPLIATTTSVEGLYPATPGRAKTVDVDARALRGGTLVTTISSDPDLFRQDQVVTASIARPRGRAHQGRPDGEAHASHPARPIERHLPVVFGSRARACPGGGDTRELGAHFSFDYRP